MRADFQKPGPLPPASEEEGEGPCLSASTTSCSCVPAIPHAQFWPNPSCARTRWPFPRILGGQSAKGEVPSDCIACAVEPRLSHGRFAFEDGAFESGAAALTNCKQAQRSSPPEESTAQVKSINGSVKIGPFFQRLPKTSTAGSILLPTDVGCAGRSAMKLRFASRPKTYTNAPNHRRAVSKTPLCR